MKPRIFSGKKITLCILKGGMPFKTHKVIIKKMCVPNLKFSDPLPETLLFFIWPYQSKYACVFSGGCMISPGTEKSLLVSAKLIGVDKEELREALVSRVMQATRGGVKGTAIK